MERTEVLRSTPAGVSVVERWVEEEEEVGTLL